MPKRAFVTKITPAGGGKPIEVTVLAEGMWEAKTLIEEKYGPVRTWWYQPVEAKFLKTFKATIVRDNGGETIDVSVLATGPQEAERIIKKEHGPVRNWVSPLAAVEQPETTAPNPQDLD